MPYLGHATPAFILLWAGLTVRAVYYYIASEGDAQFPAESSRRRTVVPLKRNFQ